MGDNLGCSRAFRPGIESGVTGNANAEGVDSRPAGKWVPRGVVGGLTVPVVTSFEEVEGSGDLSVPADIPETVRGSLGKYKCNNRT